MAPLRLDDCQIHWVEQNKDRVLSLLSQKGNTKKKVHKALLLEPHHMEADIRYTLIESIMRIGFNMSKLVSNYSRGSLLLGRKRALKRAGSHCPRELNG